MKYSNTIQEYTDGLIELLGERTTGGQRTYGFEYEFMPEDILTLGHMEKIYDFLPESGFVKSGNTFYHENGLYITFEPGGQIEYHSIPILSGDRESVEMSLSVIKKTNADIKNHLDINYIGRGYIPGRGSAPLCLISDRYKNLHKRLKTSGTRGLEMMKGTASIHYHASICNIEELAALFVCLRHISKDKTFKMSPERRDIWDNTDACRSGTLISDIDKNISYREFIEKLVTVTTDAEMIDENIPFRQCENQNFQAFMGHLTTMFTDVRLNIKGPTIELRTTDSIPMEMFRQKWDYFISMIENDFG